MIPCRLLLTCIGGPFMGATIADLRSSREVDYTLFGVDASPCPPARVLLDGFAQVPRGDEPGYVEALYAVVENFRPDVVLPWSDEEAKAVSQEVLLGRLKCRAICAESSLVATLNSKARTYFALRGKPYGPEYRLGMHADEVLESLRALGHPTLPLILKPDSGRGSRAILNLYGKTFSRQEAEDYIDANGPAVMMPQYYPPFFDADIFDGRCVGVKQRLSLDCNLFLGAISVDRSDVVEVAEDAARTLNLTAIHDIDIMRDDKGNLRVIEVNSRPSSMLVLTMLNEQNVIDQAVRKLICCGEKQERPSGGCDMP